MLGFARTDNEFLVRCLSYIVNSAVRHGGR